VYSRAVLVICLLVLAGCNGVPAGDPTEARTVTPAPVPDATDRPDSGGGTTDAPEIGIVDGAVDGAALGAAHADVRGIPHTRTHGISVRSDGTALLEYRGVLTLVGSESRRLREYAGPETARYLPGDSGATSAREERYVADGETQVRRTVDGALRETDGPRPNRLRSPVDVGDEAAIVETLLDGATVVDGGSSPGYRVAASGVDPVAVPEFLEAPRNGTVRASIRRDGRVTRIEVRYEATLDGRQVTVEQTLEWSRPSEPVQPAWAED
jgi:hypothetical protein